MEKIDLSAYLSGNEYPGRGICIGVTPDGKQALIGYFIMGRSANSRNRVFAPIEGGIETRAADPAKLEDPHLIIYNPVLTLGDEHIVTNGDQTNTIYDASQQGGSFESGLRTRTFEPDGPNYTPSGTSSSMASPWQARAISSAPTSATAAPSPVLRASLCGWPCRTASRPSPRCCGPA